MFLYMSCHRFEFKDDPAGKVFQRPELRAQRERRRESSERGGESPARGGAAAGGFSDKHDTITPFISSVPQSTNIPQVIFTMTILCSVHPLKL